MPNRPMNPQQRTQFEIQRRQAQGRAAPGFQAKQQAQQMGFKNPAQFNAFNNAMGQVGAGPTPPQGPSGPMPPQQMPYGVPRSPMGQQGGFNFQGGPTPPGAFGQVGATPISSGFAGGFGMSDGSWQPPSGQNIDPGFNIKRPPMPNQPVGITSPPPKMGY